MSTLAFYAADTLGMTLYQLPSQLEGKQIRPVKFGPWKIDLHIDAISDIVNDKEVTFWVTLENALSLYVVVREKESWMLVLDAKDKAGLDLPRGETTVRERITQLKPVTKASFRWGDDRWERITFVK